MNGTASCCSASPFILVLEREHGSGLMAPNWSLTLQASLTNTCQLAFLAQADGQVVADSWQILGIPIPWNG